MQLYVIYADEVRKLHDFPDDGDDPVCNMPGCDHPGEFVDEAAFNPSGMDGRIICSVHLVDMLNNGAVVGNVVQGTGV